MSKKLETAFKTLLSEQQIINPSYSHYGGLSGFQDYGIIGSKIKQNLLTVWRSHWLDNGIDEVEIPDIVPQAVLKASGHVDRFTDQIVEWHGIEIRADHLVKDIYKHLGLDDNSVESMSTSEIEDIINENIDYVVSNYLSTQDDTSTCKEGTPILKVGMKSLMLGINDGSLYLMRPELAQTIYPNFRRYYDYHHGRLPFGIAQIGRSYRNEISPKSFERLRSFTQAEIEYFYDPKSNHHPEWSVISSLIVPLLSSNSQLEGSKAFEISLLEAFNTNIIKDKITATFIGKVYKFALKIGLRSSQIRFRQHLPTEMAHYAMDCWDLECLINNERWLECVGIANRGDYDLRVHDRNNMFRIYREKETLRRKLELEPGYIGRTYRERAREIIAKFNQYVNECQISDNVDISLKLDDGVDIVISSACMVEKKYYEQESFYPHVVEPSFGIDRLFYAVLWQNYWIRESEEVITEKFDNLRQVLSLRPCLSPYDISVLYLANNPAIITIVEKIKRELDSSGFKIYHGTGIGSIGKKYVRTDRIGIPFVITVDFESLTDNKVTMRTRDDMSQIRIDISNLREILSEGLRQQSI